MSSLRRKNVTENNDIEPSPANKKVFIQKRLSQTNKNLFASVKGMSWSASRGSMTIEAALLLPLFLFFFFHLAGLMEMLRLHGKMEAALWNTGNQIALYVDTFPELTETMPGAGLSYLFVQNGVEKFLGEEYLKSSPLVYGVEGLNYLRSEYMDTEECVDIVVTYQVKPPVTIFPFGYMRMGNRYYARCWTGYDVTKEASEHRYVYITAHGEVWHDTPKCSYIYHEVESVTTVQIREMRNIWGKAYELCEYCEDEPVGDRVYFTGEGERYHRKRDCGAIHKNVQAIEWHERLSYRACSRCVTQKETKGR